MEDPVTALQALGAEVAEGLEAFASERAAAVELARHSLVRREPVARRPRRWHWAAFGFAALALVALFSAVRSRPALSFQVGTHAARTNDQISSLGTPVQLSFSDGTLLTLGTAARAHVVSLEQHGAQVALENGVLSANVVHTGVSAWSLSAGPFSVRVTGTKFLLSWDPDRQRFSIQVTQGSVGVSGSVIGAERPVRAGETLVVSVPDRRLQLSNDDPGSAEPVVTASASLPAPSAPAASTDAQVPAAPEEPSGRGPSPSSSAWRSLATQGKMRAAYASADAAGFDKACESSTAADLLLLGDAARLAGRPDRVNQALLQLRRRFPRDPRSAAAAFILGKVAFDQGGADRVAANWFATSLREQPKGSLAREAAGRLIEALQRAGDRAGAQRAAKDYLTWYPDGPHAALARSLLP